MERDGSQTLYTVVLTGVKDDRSRMRVAQTLSSVSGKLPMEVVEEKLDALPWTLARKAPYKKAYRLTKLLEGLGGLVRCVPPLPNKAVLLADETQILQGSGLISATQVMTATQFIPNPDESWLPDEQREKSPGTGSPQSMASADATSHEEHENRAPQGDVTAAESASSNKRVWQILTGVIITFIIAGCWLLAARILPRIWG